MDDFWLRVVEDMMARVSGPMNFRLVLQPLIAVIFGVRAGLADAKGGKPPYFWALVTDPTHRTDMLKDGWQSVGKVFALALILDIVYQILVGRFVYPGETIIVALLLAVLPYLLLRGLVSELVRRIADRSSVGPKRRVTTVPHGRP